VEIDLDTDHFIDLTKPGVIYKHIKPTLISISLPKPSLKKRPVAKDWFIEPLTKSRVLSISPIPRFVLV
jgi:hypothetical protein